MRAIVYRAYGPPDVLRLEEVPRPEPRTGEVLVRNRAVSVSSSDCAFRAADPLFARLATGLRRPRHPVLGSEVAGEVVAVGPDVATPRQGDRVVAVTGLEMGGYAEYTRLPAAGVAPLPAGMGFADAVAVVEGGLTALPFLRDHGAVRPGQRVLVNGAAGAVGASAVQLAAHFGAVVTGVCGPANLELVRSLGADEVVDHTAADFTTARDTYDVVFDAVGKSSFRRCRGALRPGGIYLTTVPDLAVLVRMPLPRRARSRRAALAFTGLRSAEAMARDMAALLALAEAGALRPVIDRQRPLAEAAEVHRHVDRGHKRGTALLVPDEIQA